MPPPRLPSKISSRQRYCVMKWGIRMPSSITRLCKSSLQVRASAPGWKHGPKPATIEALGQNTRFEWTMVSSNL